MVHLNFAVLLADHRADIGRQILLQRLLIGPLGGVLAAFALVEDGMLVHPGDRRADIDPEAMQLPGRRAAVLRIAAQLADFLLQLPGAEPAALGLLLEKCLELRVLDRVHASAKALLAVLAGLDQVVKGADDIVAVHRPNPSVARRARGAGYLLAETPQRRRSIRFCYSRRVQPASRDPRAGLNLGRGEHAAARRSGPVRR